jgi:DNA-binding response OmpR family regulator
LGYEVDIAQDGQEAWEKISLDPKGYDLVLLDKMMPRMDGITLLKRVRADIRMTGLPMVMLTGADKAEDIVEGLAAGAYYYLVKPATQEVLSRVVKNALEESLRKRELHERIGQQKNNLRLLQRAVFSFRTLKEAKDLALLLSMSA